MHAKTLDYFSSLTENHIHFILQCLQYTSCFLALRHSWSLIKFGKSESAPKTIYSPLHPTSHIHLNLWKDVVALMCILLKTKHKLVF